MIQKNVIYIPFVEIALFRLINLDENRLVEISELVDFGEAEEGLDDEVGGELESLEYNIISFLENLVHKLFALLIKDGFGSKVFTFEANFSGNQTIG